MKLIQLMNGMISEPAYEFNLPFMLFIGVYIIRLSVTNIYYILTIYYYSKVLTFLQV